MLYFEQLPKGILTKYIDKFWYCQSSNFINSTLTLPLLHHELVFNFSDGYLISYQSEPGTILKNSKAWINGILTRPIVSKSFGKHEMLGVLFKPNGLKSFTNFHASEFQNNFIDPHFIFDKYFDMLLEQIQSKTDPVTKISFIEKYLMKNLKSTVSPDYLEASLRLFNLESGQRISVKETCNQISISNKSLIQSFQKFVGINPIKYLQLQSINKALFRLSKDPLQSLTALSYNLNFSDQSHFINSFKSATGITPTQYVGFVLTSKIDAASPNFISY